MSSFFEIFGRKPEYLFSAPGRTELGGNHTDHQCGRALAAAVSVDCRAQVAENGGSAISVYSEGFGSFSVSLDELEPVEDERGRSAALLRGVAAAFRRRGIDIRGFDAYISSGLRSGSGLSSSAAFEMLLASVINHFSGSGLGPTELARIGREAENEFFGKPCGLMDQLACAAGGIAEMDFSDPVRPRLSRIDFDFDSSGYALCFVDSGADHAGLTDQYFAVTDELTAVCGHFGKAVLRDVPEEEFYGELAGLRRSVGDRAVLRAMHVYDENRRVAAQADALHRGDIRSFLRLVQSSGDSSWELMQNVIPEGTSAKQELAFAIALCGHLLQGQGAYRVHGGGFAGAVQAFVPVELLREFKMGVEAVLGEGTCSQVSIKREGAGLWKSYKE